MAENHITDLEVSPELAREYGEEIARSIAYEKWQYKRARELAAQMADECPWIWRIGDGDGHFLREVVTEAYEDAGLRTEPCEYNMPVGGRDAEHIVYRFYDVEGALLYVGVTKEPYKRWEHHEKKKSWFREMAVITRSFYPDKESSYEAERRAIITERPRYNITHNGQNAPEVQ